MNQTQRKFLIDKIEKNVKQQIRILEDSIPEKPSMEVYLLHAVMSDTFDIKSKEEIKELIRQKAKSTKDRQKWMGSDWHRTSTQLVFNPRDIFIIPEEYERLFEEWQKKEKEIRDQVYSLRTQADTLVTRIQLASNKTLEKMISEVDDMGDISLMDTKLKLLNQ